MVCYFWQGMKLTIGAVKKNEEKTKREKQEGGARAVLAKSHG